MTQNGNKLSGKLELDWVNKNKTLIVSDYEKAKYEWVNILEIDRHENRKKAKGTKKKKKKIRKPNYLKIKINRVFTKNSSFFGTKIGN